jgi:GxxExxY protein
MEESAYEACLECEIKARGLAVERRKPLPLAYRDMRLECAYRIDLIVDGSVVIEVKAVEQLARIHSVQLLSYLKLAGCPVGLLINFHSSVLTNGIRRVVNGYPDSTESLPSPRPLRPSAFSALKG